MSIPAAPRRAIIWRRSIQHHAVDVRKNLDPPTSHPEDAALRTLLSAPSAESLQGILFVPAGRGFRFRRTLVPKHPIHTARPTGSRGCYNGRVPGAAAWATALWRQSSSPTFASSGELSVRGRQKEAWRQCERACRCHAAVCPGAWRVALCALVCASLSRELPWCC